MSNNKKNKFYTCKYDRPFKEIMLSVDGLSTLIWTN